MNYLRYGVNRLGIKMDVRFDKFSRLNSILNFVFLRPGFFAARSMIQLFFHIEMPVLQFPVRLPHPYGIVVNPNCKIGKNVTLYQGVTLGGKRTGGRAGVPTIGEDVVIYPNAIVVGHVNIGAGATIAPGSVVVKDVPPGAVVAGNPARVI